jgi:hypothetical protein
MDGLEVGSEFEVALIGPLVGGIVGLWPPEGEPIPWIPDDPAPLASRLGRGLLARAPREEHRSREIVLVSRDRTTVMLAGRTAVGQPADGQVLTGRVADAVPGDEDMWIDFARWLNGVVLDAAERGEFVVVERAGPFTDEPYALAFLGPGDDGAGELIHLEAVPAPQGSAVWPPTDDPRGQSISAEATLDAVRVVGILLTEACLGWAESPHGLAVTFGTVPTGDPTEADRPTTAN